MALACGLTAALAPGGLTAAGEPRAGSPSRSAAEVEFFEREIRPLLVENCHQCHGPDEQQGGLRLDSLSGLLAGGDSGPAIVPGKPEESLLVEAVRYAPDGYQMPPTGKLAEGAIARLVEWVARGAPWGHEPTAAAAPAIEPFDLEARRARHWSFQPLARHEPPAVDAPWARGPIDRFLAARQAEAGLVAAPAADRYTLLRRLAFDLLGLPPTPDAIAEFAADDSPDADQRLVERLLASPHYGERWGRHWLDLVRYAETAGHEFDFDLPDAWRYRDYVVRALNDDLPYDRFVIEHLAGDLLEAPRRGPDGGSESLLATGFFWLGESIHSPVDVLEEEAKRVDNQLDVFGKAFLGLTIACARCHDHKFDPISARDYYALAGIFKSTRYAHAALDPPGEPLSLPAADDLQALARLAAAAWSRQLVACGDDPARREMLASARIAAPFEPPAADDLVFADFSRLDGHEWFASGPAWAGPPLPAAIVRIDLHGAGPRLSLAPAGTLVGSAWPAAWGQLRSADFEISRDKICYRVRGRGVRLRVIVDGFQRIREPIYGPLERTVDSPNDWSWIVQDVAMWRGHRAYLEVLDDGEGYLDLDEIRFTDRPPVAPPEPVLDPTLAAALAEADPQMRRLQLSVLAEATFSALGWTRAPGNDAARASLPAPVRGAPGSAPTSDTVSSKAATSDTASAEAPAAAEPARSASGAAREASPQAAAQAAARVEALLAAGVFTADLATLAADATLDPALNTPAMIDAVERLVAAAHRAAAEVPPPRRAMTAVDGSGHDDRLQIRGSHKHLGDVVPRRFLEALAGPGQPPITTGSGRRELAQRLVDPAHNPLLARVIVNRVWHHHFGRGLVATCDDFGAMGQPPTHPELLDWLAGEFIAHGWSLKWLHRQIVDSHAYRQSSRGSPDAVGRDPDNLLLARAHVRRLEAEAVRDALLAVSGRLDRGLGGPSVAVHLTEFMQGRGRPEHSGPLDAQGRRSLYVNVRRNFLSPLFLAFDYPQPFSTMGRRSASNVPAQALALLNNPLVWQQAEAWAARLVAADARDPAPDAPAPSPDASPDRFSRARDRARLAEMLLAALGRPIEPAEEEALVAFLAGRRSAARAAAPPVSPEAVELAAWTEVAHAIFNLKEFVFVR